MAEPWTDEPSRSWRWVSRRAWLPRRTFDEGWIWGSRYWMWECIWGWGFHDHYPYKNKTSCESFRPSEERVFVHDQY